MKTICIFLADGFEETEAVAPLDIFRRAGLDAKFVSISDQKQVVGAHGIAIEADLLFDQIHSSQIEMIVLPGGMPGAANLDIHKGLNDLIMKFAEENKPISAICAAPFILGKRGLLEGRKATCYPGFENFLMGADYTAEPVEKDGNYITGKGPGAAFAFAYAIVEKYCGSRKVEELKSQMMYND